MSNKNRKTSQELPLQCVNCTSFNCDGCTVQEPMLNFQREVEMS